MSAGERPGPLTLDEATQLTLLLGERDAAGALGHLDDIGAHPLEVAVYLANLSGRLSRDLAAREHGGSAHELVFGLSSAEGEAPLWAQAVSAAANEQHDTAADLITALMDWPGGEQQRQLVDLMGLTADLIGMTKRHMTAGGSN